MENWTQIAAEVDAAIKSIGSTDAGFICTLRKPGTPTGPEYNPTPGTPTLYDVAVVDNVIRVKDQNGTLTGETMRTLTIPATGVVPAKADTIAVGVAKADVDANTIYSEIIEVRPLSPAGTAVLYELDVNF